MAIASTDRATVDWDGLQMTVPFPCVLMIAMDTANASMDHVFASPSSQVWTAPCSAAQASAQTEGTATTARATAQAELLALIAEWLLATTGANLVGDVWMAHVCVRKGSLVPTAPSRLVWLDVVMVECVLMDFASALPS